MKVSEEELEEAFTPDGMLKLINREAKEINHLSDEELFTLWSFFKFLIREEEDAIFVTTTRSLVWENRKILEKRYKIQIEAHNDAVMAG